MRSLLTAERTAQQRVMSTSKNVETCTALSIDLRRLRAIILRIVDMFSVTSSPSAGAARARRRGAGRRLHGRCRGGRRRGGRSGSGGRSRRGRGGLRRRRGALSTSFLVTRPPRPVPAICAMSSPCSATMRATTGDMNERRSRLSPFASASDPAAEAGAGAPTTGIAWKCGASAEAGGATSGDSGGAAAAGCSAGAGASAAGARRGRPRRALRELRSATAAAGVDHGDPRAHVDRLALGHEDLFDRAGGRGGHLGVDLVGRDLDDGLVRLDRRHRPACAR